MELDNFIKIDVILVSFIMMVVLNVIIIYFTIA